MLLQTLHNLDTSWKLVHKHIPSAQIYYVGGCVRDALLGRVPKDVDYVVTGVDVSEFENATGLKGHGQSFFVYIHPETQCEIALARSERKVSAGYTGFEMESGSHITIEMDLHRRDLTINSMAVNAVTGELIDPFNGQFHLTQKRLVPTSPAFKEDPVRALRIGRFYARYGTEWSIGDEAYQYTTEMINSGEFANIPASRISNEISLSLETVNPWLFFKWCEDCGIDFLYHKMINSSSPWLKTPSNNLTLSSALIASGANKKGVDFLNINAKSINELISTPQLFNDDMDNILVIINTHKLYTNHSKLILWKNASCLIHPDRIDFFNTLARHIVQIAKDVKYSSLLESGMSPISDPTLISVAVNKERDKMLQKKLLGDE